MAAPSDERQLWQHGPFACVMVSCCSGAELQIRKQNDVANDEEIILRELYPTKSDLYERARELASDYGSKAIP